MFVVVSLVTHICETARGRLLANHNLNLSFTRSLSLSLAIFPCFIDHLNGCAELCAHSFQAETMKAERTKEKLFKRMSKKWKQREQMARRMRICNFVAIAHFRRCRVIMQPNHSLSLFMVKPFTHIILSFQCPFGFWFLNFAFSESCPSRNEIAPVNPFLEIHSSHWMAHSNLRQKSSFN